MEYRVEVSERAARDIEEAFEYIRLRAPENAWRWRRRLEQRLQVLITSPEAFGFAPEDTEAKAEIRQVLFGKYRILYTVRRQTVFILTVRHGARLFLSGGEIDAMQ